MMLRRLLTGLAAILLAGTTAACSGNTAGGWTAPGKGQAAQLLDFSQNGRDASTRTVAFYGFNGEVYGMTTGPDGSVYALGQKPVRLKPDRTVSTVPLGTVEGGTLRGLVALSDGSLVYGSDGQIKQFQPDGRTTVLAGVQGQTRVPGNPVPASAAATDVRFTAGAGPFGTESDGTILVADQDVVWALKDGTVRRLYLLTAEHQGLPYELDQNNAVDSTGTAYLSPQNYQPQVAGTLGDVVTVSPDGTVGKLSLPAHLAGLPGALSSYRVQWLTGDSADGVFAEVYGPSGNDEAVVHLHSGTADLVAHQDAGVGDGQPCTITSPVDALHLPCVLPQAMTYRSGSLVLGGTADYVLQIRVG